MTKKLIALLLSLALLFGLVPVAFAESPADTEPIILLSGFTSTQLFAYPNDPERRTHVWDLDFNTVGGEVLRELPGLLGGLLIWLVTRHSGIVSCAFERAAEQAIGMLRMHPDGSPAYDVGHFPGTAEDWSLAAIRANEDPNAWRMGQLGAFARYFETHIGAENIFVFQYDWRQSNVETARRLRAFIQDVKQLTGSATVRLFANSYGGQLAGVYLADFASDRDVSRVIMDVPALGGSSMIPGLFTGSDVQVNIGTFLRFMESYSGSEGGRDFGWLLDLLPQQCLAPLLVDLLQAGLLPVARSWGGLWDLIPAADFDATLQTVMGDDEYWWLADSIRLHHEIMPNWGEILRRAQDDYDIAVRIVATPGSQQLFGQTGRNSDGLLDVAYKTGARVAPLGQRLAYGERLSPGQNIDAATAWLPDHTWFIEGQFHGASWGDPYAFALLTALMFDNDLNTVHCDPAFPQFALSRSPSRELWTDFDGETLRVENITHGQTIRVLAVHGLCVELPRGTALAPGEVLSLPLADTIPAGSFASLRVFYRIEPDGLALPIRRSRTFDITF